MTDVNQQLLEALQKLMAQPAAAVTFGSPAVTNITPAFGTQPPQAVGGLPAPLAVLVPLTLQTRDGEVNIYLQFGPECADPAVVAQFVDALQAARWPVKAWRQKNRDDGGRNFGGGGGDRGYGDRNFGGGGGNDRGGWRGR